jgi:hypothetical protein
VDINGERAVAPAFGGTADFESDMTSPVPYYPGREALWIGGSGVSRAEVDDRELVHPIATGSEAYYRYSSGDSLIFTLPDGARITLRELRVEPRRPEWRLSVGSFWFDASSGQRRSTASLLRWTSGRWRRKSRSGRRRIPRVTVA